MGRNGEPGAFGLAAARGGVASTGVGARFARLGTGIGIGAGTSNVASEPLRDRTEGDAVDESHVSGAPRALIYPSIRSRNGMRATDWLRCGPSRNVGEPPPSNTEIPSRGGAAVMSQDVDQIWGRFERRWTPHTHTGTGV